MFPVKWCSYFNPVSPLLYKDPTLEFLRKFTIGLVSGTISSCVNIPFDVAKSRIQGPQPVPGEIKYRTCFQTMALVYREEGYEQRGDKWGILGTKFVTLSTVHPRINEALSLLC